MSKANGSPVSIPLISPCGLVSMARLATGNLTWDDVKVVPVPAVNEGIDALIQGRADVSNHTVGSAKIKEADAAIGVRFVALDCSAPRRSAPQKSRSGVLSDDIKIRQLQRHRRRYLRPGL